MYLDEISLVANILFWGIVIIFAVVVEITTVQLVSVWFAVAGAISLILAAFDVPAIYQVVVFFVLSLILFIVSRFLFKKIKTTNIEGTAEGLIGENVIVTKDIVIDGFGEIKAKFDYYSAKSENNELIEAGNKAEIVAIEGNKVIVRKK